MEALPGVVSVGGTTRVPLGSTSVTTSVQIEGRPVPDRRAAGSAVPPRDAQLLRRRWAFRSAAAATSIRTTAPTAPPVAVINETMARTAVSRPGSDRPARAHRPERHRPVDHDRRRHRRHPSRRPRGRAAARAVHQLPAGPAGVAVHRAAHDRRSGGAGRNGARRGARASTRTCRSTTCARCRRCARTRCRRGASSC